ncbi:MAG: hypothetical protein KatS3mg113_0287 [Planctomycetaceae bacterium]|nr:MAG: hypothetical protein KatS3mg113_0287 [Planctomycetaceae bacterium]
MSLESDPNAQMSPVIRTLVFDMGNVLLYFSHERMCQQLAELFDCSAQEMRAWLFAEHWQESFERGLITGDELTLRMNERWQKQISLERVYQACCDIFHPNIELMRLLPALKARGFRLLLLSNTHRWHIEFVRRRYEIWSWFDDLILSCDVQAMKPEDAIFRAVEQRADCSPFQIFYTDDITQYVQAARHRGWHAFVYRDMPTFVRDLQSVGITSPTQC